MSYLYIAQVYPSHILSEKFDFSFSNIKYEWARSVYINRNMKPLSGNVSHYLISLGTLMAGFVKHGPVWFPCLKVTA